MAIVNISLPDKMREYIDERMREGSYNTTSEYFRDLIREDQKRQAEKRLETLLIKGIESPEGTWTKDDIDDVKKLVRERLAEKKSER